MAIAELPEQKLKEILEIIHDINQNAHSSRFGMRNDIEKVQQLEMKLEEKVNQAFSRTSEQISGEMTQNQWGSHARRIIEEEIRGLTTTISLKSSEGVAPYRWDDSYQEGIIEPYYLHGADVRWIENHNHFSQRTIYRVKSEKILPFIWDSLYGRFFLPTEGIVRPAEIEDLSQIRLLEAKIFVKENRWKEGPGQLEDAFLRFPEGFYVYDVNGVILGYLSFLPANEQLIEFCSEEEDTDIVDGWDVFDHILTKEEMEKTPKAILFVETICHLEDSRGVNIGEMLLLKLIEKLAKIPNLGYLTTITVTEEGANLVTGIKALLCQRPNRIGNLICTSAEPVIHRPWKGLMRDFYLFKFEKYH